MKPSLSIVKESLFGWNLCYTTDNGTAISMPADSKEEAERMVYANDKQILVRYIRSFVKNGEKKIRYVQSWNYQKLLTAMFIGIKENVERLASSDAHNEGLVDAIELSLMKIKPNDQRKPQKQAWLNVHNLLNEFYNRHCKKQHTNHQNA